MDPVRATKKNRRRITHRSGDRVHMRILFYGDSNTYGYDPADLREMRYPQHKRWTYLLQQMNPGQWEIIPEGMNGRQLPDLKYDAAGICRMLSTLQQGDLFAVMLGTNDILLTMDADIVTEKMQRFLEYLTGKKETAGILVIAPPHIGRKEIRDPLYQRYYLESKKMNKKFRELAETFRVNFADAGEWEVEMSADLVHLSERGHRQFSERLGAYLQKLAEDRKAAEAAAQPGEVPADRNG